jgi:ribosomal protein S15P/S13E
VPAQPEPVHAGSRPITAPLVAPAEAPSASGADAPARVPTQPSLAPAAPAVANPPEVLAGPPVDLAPISGSIDDLARHLRDNPTDVASRLALAIGYEQRDDYARSAEQYRQLIKGREVPVNVLEVVTGNLREMLEAQPDNGVLHRLLGDCYMKQGQFQMAISQYNWLLQRGGR